MRSLSLVIPCYNESANLPLLLDRCKEVAGQCEGIEIVIVDNGSTDDSAAVLDRLLPGYPFVTRVTVELNQGYGHGILSGLRKAGGEVIGWTHADMQTDPGDVLEGVHFFDDSQHPENVFVKGKRYGRPLMDVFFTVGMALFETVLLRKVMWDINAQPTLFHRNFFEGWESPPEDFSLDLYAYYKAKMSGLQLHRFPVLFGERAHGVSHWNISLAAKYHFIKRTLTYSFALQKRVSRNG